jgi:hypothetical protein
MPRDYNKPPLSVRIDKLTTRLRASFKKKADRAKLKQDTSNISERDLMKELIEIDINIDDNNDKPEK